VKSDANFHGDYPLCTILVPFDPYSTASASINTIRLLLQEPDLTEYVDILRGRGMMTLPVETLIWIWRNRTDVFGGQDMSALEVVYVRSLLNQLHVTESRPLTIEYLMGEFACTLSNGVINGSFPFLEDLFHANMQWYCPTRSFELGEVFLDIVRGVGVDFIECISKELGKYPEGIMVPIHIDIHAARKIHFGYTPGVGWRLGWEWLFDEKEPGYMVISMYSALAANSPSNSSFWDLEDDGFPIATPRELEWTFEEHRCAQDRFARRSAAKARKELARMGLKQPRGKMPGSWIE
jgi:hypothetical protein